MSRRPHIPLPPRRLMLLLALILLQITVLAFAQGGLRIGAFIFNLDDGWTSFHYGSANGLFANDPDFTTLPGLHTHYHTEPCGVYLSVECHWLLLTLLSLPVILPTLAGVARLRRILSPYMLRLPPLPRHLLVAMLFVTCASTFAWTISYLQADCYLRLWKVWFWIAGGSDGIVQVEMPFFELKTPRAIDLNYLKVLLGFTSFGSTKPLLIIAMQWWILPLAFSLTLLPIVLFRATRRRSPTAFPVIPASMNPKSPNQPQADPADH